MKQESSSKNWQEASNAQADFDKTIITDHVHFAYSLSGSDNKDITAVQDVSIKVTQGQHITILGRNGSGKSTLAKLINALELPDQGVVSVFGKNTLDEKLLWLIRQSCGMVFQNPDNQIVGTTVEEDVAFGPENIGIPSTEIRKRVDDALAEVGLSEYKAKMPTQLSGGQKQKLAIAGILAMQPTCIILDEATSMLDPKAANDLMRLIKRLQKEFGMTIIEITHDIEKAVFADYIYIMQNGKIFYSGTPRDVFTKPDKVLSAGLNLPEHLYISYLYRNNFSPATIQKYQEKFADDYFTPEETAQAMFELNKIGMPNKIDISFEPRSKSDKKIIRVKDLSFTYQRNTDFAVQAVKNISFNVNEGEIIAIVGHSGSGKSTLISHLNGLILPQQGDVEIMNLNTKNKKNIQKIRKKLGLLFQYPEHQLFENTVYEDIAFGPKQFGIVEPALSKNIKRAIDIVGLPQDILERSPFELSGGQQRRVAIAGVLATDCDIYVLDEPAAGLDPIGQEEILDYIQHLGELGKTIIIVTHDMKLAAKADRVIVLNDGSLLGYDTVENIFSNQELLGKSGLNPPSAYKFSRLLSEVFSDSIGGYTAEQVNHSLIHSINKKMETE